MRDELLALNKFGYKDGPNLMPEVQEAYFPNDLKKLFLFHIDKVFSISTIIQGNWSQLVREINNLEIKLSDETWY